MKFEITRPDGIKLNKETNDPDYIKVLKSKGWKEVSAPKKVSKSKSKKKKK